MPQSPGPPDQPSDRKDQASFLTIFPSIMLPMFLAVIDQTIVAGALPDIAGDLGSVEWTSAVVVAYLAAATTISPAYGRLGDAFGRRRFMFIALGVFGVASILCALAQNIGMLIAARILQGLGGGGLMTLSHALIGDTVPPRDRARYQGYIAAVAVSSNSFGPVVGGILVEHFGWRSIFFVNIPLVALAALLVFRLPVRTLEREPFRFDMIGLLLFALIVSTLLAALQEMQRLRGDTIPIVVGLGLAGVVALILLIAQERRASDPLLPGSVLRNPSIWRCDLMAACHGAMMVSLITYLPIYYRVMHGLSPAEVGILILPMTVAIGVSSMIVGRVIARTGHLSLFPVLGMISAAATLIFLAIGAPYISATGVSVVLALNAGFMGTVMGVVQVTVQMAAGPRLLGTAAATVQFSRAFGAAFGTALSGVVLFTMIALAGPETSGAFVSVLQHGKDTLVHLPPDHREFVEIGFVGAFRAVFLTIAAFATISAAIAWTVPLRRI